MFSENISKKHLKDFVFKKQLKYARKLLEIGNFSTASRNETYLQDDVVS